ncbi:MAG: L-glutamate gamma-semialdehyde dehydrogenase, partial [Pseudomonadota bacterium]
NSSFLNQVLDKNTSVEKIATDPFESLPKKLAYYIKHPKDLFAPRINSKGWNIYDISDLSAIETQRSLFLHTTWQVTPILAKALKNQVFKPQKNPATGDIIANICVSDQATLKTALKLASKWDVETRKRADILRKAAGLYEQNYGEIFAILSKEAGKTIPDAIAELREAVDFIRYYADEAEKYDGDACGIIACISPWNFPLAIFTGQIVAALGAGNGVIAKPSELTPVIAMRAVNWLHQAGVPKTALQFLPGEGTIIGDALTSASTINGVCFTGSTSTAQSINRNMATYLTPKAKLIAETGGLNAMIIDSTALPEQAVRDIIISAFQSAGQRCSACRIVYIQNSVADTILNMLFGAMDALILGDPWFLSTDIGPVIDKNAQVKILNWVKKQRAFGRVIKEVTPPKNNYFVGPTVIALDHINQLEQEIFGPIVHVVRFDINDFDDIIDDINAKGFGLTFAMHSRIDDRVEKICNRVNVGNIYINRNQIGAVVGSQPFGGVGLSGTGPKAGGPLYLNSFYKEPVLSEIAQKITMPGPTGESNKWSRSPKPIVLCLGPDEKNAKAQQKMAQKEGCKAILANQLTPEDVYAYPDVSTCIYWGDQAQFFRQALAKRQGAIIPLITNKKPACFLWNEQHICVDTTASGGNRELLSR